MPSTPGRPEVVWLQPIPDALVEAASADPATIVVSRASMRLALIASLQHLPARQRVVLILRDVLAWRAAEVAELLGTTTAAVKSALQRARARLEEAAPAEDRVVEPAGADQRALLDRYMKAFQDADIAGLLRLLREDAQWEMPPLPAWFAGRQAIGRFLASQVFGTPRAWRMVPTRANGQPAFATYLRGPDGGYHAHAIQVLTVTSEGSHGSSPSSTRACSSSSACRRPMTPLPRPRPPPRHPDRSPIMLDQMGLLERAIGYALGSVAAVAPRLLSRPTPCSDWDLRALLGHVNDSLAALCEGVDSGRIGQDPAADDGHGLAGDLAATFRDRARRLLGAWSSAGRHDRLIAIVDRPLPAAVVAGTGAIELAVHGWDISWACGQHRSIPPTLASDLLTTCPLLVTQATRHPQFGAPVAVSPLASASDRLVAFLGRRPQG